MKGIINNQNALIAEKFLENHPNLSFYDVVDFDEGGYLGVNESKLYTIMSEFARYHVERALKEAVGEAPLHYSEGIKNCYPLDQIK